MKAKLVNKRKKNYKKLEPPRESFDYEVMEYFLAGQHATEAIIQKFADEQLKFYCENDAYHLEEYRLRRGLAESTYYDWLQKSPYLKERHEFVKQIIALKRKKCIVKGDPKFLTHTLHMYDKRHDEANKYKARLKSLEHDDVAQNIKVVFEKFKDEKSNDK